MKKLYLIITLTIISNLCISQDYLPIDTIRTEFYYDYNFQQDSTDKTNVKYQEMVLQVGKKYSQFSAVNKLYCDSLTASVKGTDIKTEFNKIWPKMRGAITHGFCSYYIYKNYPRKGNIRFFGSLGVKKKFIVDDPVLLKWQLLENSDSTIMGFSCQKAICNFAGRTYEAWYATEIPIDDGPYKFHGLPGLIIRIADNEKQHIFQLYKIKNRDDSRKLIYAHNTDSQNTSASDYAKAMRITLAERYQKYSGSTSPIQYQNPEQETRVLRNLRTRNNYIEKY